MRTYFIVLFGLLLVTVFVSYKIAATLPFFGPDDQMSPRFPLVSNDSGTSACFEKRYSPQIRECGSLLQYSAPALSYRLDESPKYLPTYKRRHLSGRLSARERSRKTGAVLGKIEHLSVPRHSDMANF
jgi:hypothetical protein